jgi:hypothetical protein
MIGHWRVNGFERLHFGFGHYGNRGQIDRVWFCECKANPWLIRMSRHIIMNRFVSYPENLQNARLAHAHLFPPKMGNS